MIRRRRLKWLMRRVDIIYCFSCLLAGLLFGVALGYLWCYGVQRKQLLAVRELMVNPRVCGDCYKMDNRWMGREER